MHVSTMVFVFIFGQRWFHDVGLDQLHAFYEQQWICPKDVRLLLIEGF